MGAQLAPFGGHPVVKSAVQITRAGDGLSEALELDPEELDQFDTVFFVLKGIVDKVTFGPTKPGSEDLVRKHVIVTTEIIRVEEGAVSKMLRAAADTLKKAKEEAAGIQRLGFAPTSDEEADLMVAHANSEHKPTDTNLSGLVEGCPVCQQERDAIEAERVADGVRTEGGSVTPIKAKRTRKAASAPKE
jgi:hypothetical protein